MATEQSAPDQNAARQDEPEQDDDPGQDGRLVRLRSLAATYALLPLRLFLGVTYVYAAVDKLADAHYLAGAVDPASFVSQTQAARAGSPIGWALGPALHLPTFSALVIAFGELAIGLGTLFGLWGRIAAAGGALISFTLWLTVSWNISPYFLGNDLAYLMAWTPLLLVGTPYLSVDGFLLRRAERERKKGLSESAVRRRVLMDGGIAAVALGGAGLLFGSLVATFGRRKPARTAASPQPGSVGAKPPAAKATVAAAAVPVGGSAQVRDPATGDLVYIVQPAAGQYLAFSSVCTHAGCAVDAPKDGQLKCPCHGSRFDATTGAPANGPAVKPLQRYTVTRNGDQLELGGTI